jgi:hypothetical protein
MSVKGDKWRGGWNQEYADKFDKIFKREKNKMKDKLKLTKEQIEKLEALAGDITKEARNVIKDYTDNPSKMSGSITQVHENSPYLKEREERLVTIDGKEIKIKPDSK